MRKILSISFFSIFCLTILPQNPLKHDSLMTVFNYAKSDTQKIYTLLRLSEYYYSIDFNRAIDFAGEALDFSHKTGDKTLAGRSQLQIGKIYIYAGQYDKALKNCLVSLKIFESNKSEADLFSTYLVIGSLYDRIFNYDEALTNYFKALNICNELKKTDLKKVTSLPEQTLYNNIGNIYETRNENNDAIKYYQKALEIGLLKNDFHLLGVVYNNLGKIHDKLGEHDVAYKYLTLSLGAREKIGDKAGMAKSYYFLSSHFLSLDNYDQAIKYALESNELGRQVGSLQTQHTSIWFLFQTYYELGDYRKALEYHIIFKDLSDSLLNSNTMNELTKLKMEYEYNSKQNETELKLQKTRIKYILALTLLVLGVTILALSLIILRNRAKRVSLEKDNLEKDIELKNKELTTNVLYLISKNEMISDISSKLLKLKSRMKEEDQKILSNLIYDLSSASNDSIWQEFEYRFHQVHTQFYQNLQKGYPDLTPAEVKLAAFLRLNMSSKDISSITGQSIRSLEVARYRLRKKLNITNQEINLVTFLSEL